MKIGDKVKIKSKSIGSSFNKSFIIKTGRMKKCKYFYIVGIREYRHSNKKVYSVNYKKDFKTGDHFLEKDLELYNSYILPDKLFEF